MKIKPHIGSEHSAPRRTLAASDIEQSYRHIVDKRIYNDVIAAMSAAVLHAFRFGGTFGDNCLGGYFLSVLLKGEPHAFLSHFYHSEIIALDSSGFDEADNILACKPTVSQQIIKPIPILDGSFDHLLEKFDFASGIVLHALCGRTLLVTFLFKSRIQLSGGHGMIPGFTRLSNKFKIDNLLTLSITDGQHQRFEAERHLVGDMAEDAANLFGMKPALGIVSVVDYEADRHARMIRTDRNLPPKLDGDVVRYFSPVKTVVIDKPVKDILRCAA